MLYIFVQVSFPQGNDSTSRPPYPNLGCHAFIIISSSVSISAIISTHLSTLFSSSSSSGVVAIDETFCRE